ncbi:MAG: hypothetical protein KGL39_03220 [Patescibacteria group bacterium]|nr:hypothetical protein [Patescibacteria group bacterium]
MSAQSYGANVVAGLEKSSGYVTYTKRFFSAKTRRREAKTGAAMPDGSFPISSPKDVRNALMLLHHHDTPAVRAHIRSRAKALGMGDPFQKDLAGLTGLLDPGTNTIANSAPNGPLKQGRGIQNAGPNRAKQGPDVTKARRLFG